MQADPIRVQFGVRLTRSTPLLRGQVVEIERRVTLGNVVRGWVNVFNGQAMTAGGVAMTAHLHPRPAIVVAHADAVHPRTRLDE